MCPVDWEKVAYTLYAINASMRETILLLHQCPCRSRIRMSQPSLEAYTRHSASESEPVRLFLRHSRLINQAHSIHSIRNTGQDATK
jgi:hypothetical protein